MGDDAGQPSAGWRSRMDRTRYAIQAAAMQLFRERGYGAVTVADIAARAGASPRTVFRYYPTKEAIVIEPWPGEHDAIVDALAIRPVTEHPLASILAVVDELFDREVATADDLLRVELTNREPELRAAYLARIERFAAAVAAWVAPRLGTEVDSLEVQMFAGFVGALHRVVLDRWAGAEQGTSYAELASRAVAAFDHLPVLPA